MSASPMLDARTFRPLAEADIDALQALDDAAHGHAWSRRTFLDEIERSDRVHLVAELGHRVIGHAAAWVDAASCHITNVAVASDQHGRGHATGLLLQVINRVLQDHDIANLQLHVRPSNRRAQRMYGRFGFVPVGIERSFYDRRDDRGSTDALVMAVVDVCSGPWRERLDELKASYDQEQADRATGAAA